MSEIKRYDYWLDGGMSIYDNGNWCRWSDVELIIARQDKLKAENEQLREMLWIRHGCDFHSLYGDDGCMQCSRCMIDFKDMPAETIADRFKLIGQKSLKQTLGEK